MAKFCKVNRMNRDPKEDLNTVYEKQQNGEYNAVVVFCHIVIKTNISCLFKLFE